MPDEFTVRHDGKDYRVVLRDNMSKANVYDATSGKLVTSITPFHEPGAQREVMRGTVLWYLDRLTGQVSP